MLFQSIYIDLYRLIVIRFVLLKFEGKYNYFYLIFNTY
jgi:hypothetical protein